MLTGDAFIKEILNGNPRTCYELFCMDRPTLTSLCNYLRTHKFLTNSRQITVEEAVGMFLLIVGHNVRIRVIAYRFQHSTETVDMQFKEIVRAICRLGKFIIHPSQSNEVHPCIANNTKFFPYFKVIPSYCSFYHTNIICSHMLILVFIFFSRNVQAQLMEHISVHGLQHQSQSAIGIERPQSPII